MMNLQARLTGVSGTLKKTKEYSYGKIPRKQMAAFAAKSGITLTPTLARDATKTINAFPELTRLETRIQTYIPNRTARLQTRTLAPDRTRTKRLTSNL